MTVVAATILAMATGVAVADSLIIRGTEGNDVLTGTPAADSFYGRGGNDAMSGAGGDDEFDGGAGADSFSGNEGSDVVSYSGPTPVVVTIDGIANDGAAGEGDNVGLDVEDVYGGDGDDKLSGSPAANTIDGGPGADRIVGGPGTDALFGGEGDDLIDARDGEVDRIECGPGNDTVTIDPDDIVADDCENRSKQEVTGKPGITINVRKRKLILSSVDAKSGVKVVCLRCSKKKQQKTLVARKSVSLSKGQVVVFKLPSRMKGQTVEFGVKAPDATPICLRYKIARNYRPTLSKKPCTSAAKEF